MWVANRFCVCILLVSVAMFGGTLANLAQSRVIDGNTALAGQFPHHVALIYKDRVYCGGSILNANWFITAAHCLDLDADLLKQVSIAVAAVKWKEGQRYGLSDFLVHDGYNNDDHVNDVALGKTAHPIQFFEGLVQPVAMNTNIIGGGVEVTVSGFGISVDPKVHVGSEDMFYAVLQTMTNEECSAAYGDRGEMIRDYLMCTKPVDRKVSRACYGDSGGGLLLEGQLVGVLSFVRSDCFSPVGFSRISSFANWINSKING